MDSKPNLSAHPIQTPESADLHCIALARRVAEARDQYRQLKDQSAAAYHDFETLEIQLIELMDANQLLHFKVVGLGTVIRSERIYAKIENLELAKAYFEEAGLAEQVFKMEPIKKRLNALVSAWIERGDSIPNGITYEMIPSVQIRKS